MLMFAYKKYGYKWMKEEDKHIMLEIGECVLKRGKKQEILE